MVLVEREELEAARKAREEDVKSNKPEDAKCPDVVKFDGTSTQPQEFENELENYF